MRGIRYFSFREGGGVQVRLLENSLDNVFFFFFFFYSPELILHLTEGVQ